MSNQFLGEGNIGKEPEVKQFQSGNNEPRFLLRFPVYFDNPVKGKDGKFEDKGGFWANVELWMGEEANRLADLYQKGQRVQVQGRMIRDTWKDEETDEEKSAFKIRARRVGILPFRVEEVVMRQSSGAKEERSERSEQYRDDFDDDIPF
ncbi:MAG: single-stranded DNA-binding protein [Burkholderiales bacterium]|jgi:single-strand DNA-binding protein|nr:single-stranded DNA-binding protein [Burkholderiales bacterium]